MALILSRAGQEDEHEYEPGAVQRYQALNGSIQEYLVNGYLQGKQALNDYQARYTSSEGQLTNCGKIMGEDGHNDDLITTSNDKAWLDAPKNPDCCRIEPTQCHKIFAGSVEQGQAETRNRFILQLQSCTLSWQMQQKQSANLLACSPSLASEEPA